MTLRRAGAGSPLFLRVFALMVVCVAVTQLMNFGLLIAVQTPTAKLYTVGQAVDALRGKITDDDFSVSREDRFAEQPWNPRGERTEIAMAKAMGVPVERVLISFPTPILTREKSYDRASVPRPVPPPTVQSARDVIITGDFSAAYRADDGRWVTVTTSTGFEPWRWFVLWWLVVSAAAVAPFAWALARRIAKPIGAFAEAAERLGRDPRAAPIAIEGPSEIADAAAAFNRMQARLNRYVDDRATVVGAVAHDLRTPLMRLGLRLEVAPDDLRQACERDIRDMEAMISATLSYLRDTTKQGVRKPLDLRSLAETVTDDMSDHGEPVILAPGEPVVVEGNSPALKAMLNNLIINAIKYAGSAEVSLGEADGQALIEVRDDGPGVPPEDLDRVFEPFFRGERSRNPDTGGIGLGLASARAVARAHGGDLVIRNREEGGLSALVTLPV
ncbi:signal transduction histidine kinase [Sphingomonas kyeonggiensis]|uniref:ATP-binding protein n=1 Tax=Sphingomonas kyeonggiensis TaxID=1268553 RepID=UPI002780299B|nr:ATP-binding protein [Sphingomonas kyeonggiensis]MDQ0249784.1 signal transduction histidine kinase [Sphingomonas kyeonggiensis]